MASFKGHAPVVGIQRRGNALEEKAQDILLGKRVVAVELSNSQLTIKLEDGGMFSMNCEGGFNEVN